MSAGGFATVINNSFVSYSWKTPVSSSDALPLIGNFPGDARVTLDEFSVFIWNGSAWVASSAAHGIPAGGTTDQVLAKNSDTDYDTHWVAAGTGSPSGANTSIQYNNGGSFSGFGTWSGSTFDVGGNLTGGILTGDQVSTPLLDGGYGTIDMVSNLIKNNADVIIIDWELYKLNDASGNQSVNWADRALKTSLGGPAVIIWENLKAYDLGTNESLDWNNRLLKSAAGVTTLSWDLRTASSTSGTTIDWQNGVLTENGGQPTINWGNRWLLHSGATMFSWSSGISFFGGTPAAQQTSSGAQTAGSIYGPTEQTMLQQVYDALRAYGLMT